MNINTHPAAIKNTGNLSVENQIFKTIHSSGTTNLDNITCLGPLTCSGSLKIQRSQLDTMKVSGSTDLRNSTASDIKASGHFYALDCPKLGKVQTSGYAHFVNCNEVKEIQASASLSLLNTQVDGDVIHSGRDIQVNESVIKGKLECTDTTIQVCNSQVETIVVNPLITFFSHSSFQLFGFRFVKESKSTSNPSCEQIIELTGKNCIIGSISFAEGVKGKVILKNEAQVSGEITGDFVIVRA